MKYFIGGVSLFLTAWSSLALAEEYERSDHSLKVDIGYSVISSVIESDLSSSDVSTLSRGFIGLLTYQSPIGIFGQLGYSDMNMYESKTNGVTRSEDIDSKVTTYGLGYRFDLNSSNGTYFGLGFQRGDPDESNREDIDAYRMFLEKDNARRYGILEFAFTTSDSVELFGISGKHIWFVSDVVGLGFNWAVAQGEQEGSFIQSDFDLGVASLGFNVLFRPRF